MILPKGMIEIGERCELLVCACPKQIIRKAVLVVKT
jgi:hypothetical protein